MPESQRPSPFTCGALVLGSGCIHRLCGLVGTMGGTESLSHCPCCLVVPESKPRHISDWLILGHVSKLQGEQESKPLAFLVSERYTPLLLTLRVGVVALDDVHVAKLELPFQGCPSLAGSSLALVTRHCMQFGAEAKHQFCVLCSEDRHGASERGGFYALLAHRPTAPAKCLAK